MTPTNGQNVTVTVAADAATDGVNTGPPSAATATATWDAAIVTIGDASATEGDAMTFTVTLDDAVSGGLTVTPGFTDGTATKGIDYTENTAALAFAGTAGEAQTFTVATTEDLLVEGDETFTVGLTVSGTTATVTATDTGTGTIADDETTEIVAPVALAVTEGASASFDVALSAAPLTDVMVTISGHADTDLTLDRTSLTFTTTNWRDAQPVMVTAAEDDDLTHDPVTLTLSAAGGGFDGETHDLTVTATDNDVPSLVVPSALAVTEGASGSFDVELSAAPTVTVTITISGHAVSDLTLDRKLLTFTTTNWNNAQTVLVTAADDDDFQNDQETLTLVAEGGDYDGLTHEIAVTVDDDESAEIVAPLVLSIPEGGGTSFAVALSVAPTGPVMVAISGHAGTDLTLDRTSLTFTTTNWSDAQMVTVTAAEDDDFQNGQETLTLVAEGGGYDGETHEIAVTVDDDETAELVAPLVLSVPEGESTSFDVVLSAVPTGTVTVSVQAFLNADLSRDPETLTFTTTNWSDVQTVMVTAGQDSDFVDDQETLTLTAEGGGYDGETHEIAVTVDDDETAELVVVPEALEVSEGASAPFTVALSDAPTGTVTVAITGHAGTDLELDPALLTFTTANWSIPQMVMVAAIEDDDLTNDQVTLTLTATGGDYTGVTRDLEVTVTDDDVPRLVAPAVLEVQEGFSESFAVTLSAAPSGPVTVIVPAFLNEDLSRDPGTLTFTTTNWSIAQMVTVTAAEDEDFTNDLETLTLRATGGGFDGVRHDLEVTVTDNDVPELVVMPDALFLMEGTSGSFTVALSAAPTTDVMVAISGHAGTDLTLDRTFVTFTTTDWSEAQTVSVTAGQDSDFTDDEETLTLTASGGGFADVTQDLKVIVTDDDVPGLVVAPEVLGITEGTSESFSVELSAAPSTDVMVTIIGYAGTDLTLDPTSLIFTTTNWSDAQMVTITAAEDDDFADDEVTLTLTASGGGYAGVMQDLDVTVTDNDEPGLEVLPPTLSVDEGGMAIFTATLSAAPSTDVMVTVTGHVGTDLTLNPASLTFTTTNWTDAQTVTIAAAEDDDITDDQVTLTLRASNGGYDGVTRELPVTVTDAGERALTVSVEDAEAVEGTEMLRMRVILNRPADRVVGVNYATSDRTAEQSSDYVSARGIMIFDRGATHGVVAVELKDDDLAEGNEVFEVTLTNASEGLVIGRAVGEGVIIDDDGVPLLRIDDVAVSEEEVVRFTLRLSEPSARTVTVRYRTEDGSAQAGMDYVAAAGMVQFKPGSTEAVLEVELMQDGMDWREETFTVHLEAPEHARLEKAVATATVRDETSVAAGVMAAYASRFVRTSAIHVVEALDSRMRSGVGGSDCSAGLRREESLLWHPQSSWNPSLGQLLSGCRVAAHAETPRGVFSTWGRASYTKFHGRTDNALTLQGQVSSGLVGADYHWHQGWMAGVLLAHTYGEGTFEVHQEAGDIRAGLTGVYPYAAYHRPAQTYWLTGGLGRGTSEVLTLEGDLTSRFGAAGLQGDLWSGRRLRLNYRGDMLFANAKITEHDISVRTHRVRAGMEGSIRVGGTLRPYGEVYVRRDGGNAETGTGLEIGGGMSWAYPAYRLKADVRSRRLVLHTADGFSEWGFSGALVYGGRTSGLTLALRPMWGSAARGTLYRQPVLQGQAGGLRRMVLEAGYGIPWGTRTVRSLLGMTAFAKGAMYRLGSELFTRSAFGVSVSAQVHAPPHAPPALGIHLQSRFRY